MTIIDNDFQFNVFWFQRGSKPTSSAIKNRPYHHKLQLKLLQHCSWSSSAYRDNTDRFLAGDLCMTFKFFFSFVDYLFMWHIVIKYGFLHVTANSCTLLKKISLKWAIQVISSWTANVFKVYAFPDILFFFTIGSLFLLSDPRLCGCQHGKERTCW